MEGSMTAISFVHRMLRLLCIAMAFAMALPAGSGLVSVAQAQQASERQSGGGLLRFLFQRSDRPRQDRVAPVEPKRRATTNVRRTASAPAAPAEPIVEKNENAKRVLVVGDFL